MAPTSIYNTFSCEVRAQFLGPETLSVPAGTFETQRVRIEVFQRVHGTTAAGLQSGVVAVGTFWVSPAEKRLVKGVVNYETQQPWTESMELVSTRIPANEN